MSATEESRADAPPASTESEAAPARPTSIFSASPAFQTSPSAGATAPAPAAPAATKDAAEDDQTAAEEECQAEFAPIVQLEEVETTTGEEAEATLFEMKCKLYRFDNDSNEWKERGIGIVRLLQHKENKKIRLLMRQEKTLKIRANHIVMPGTKLSPHQGNDKAWVWSTVDFADESQKIEMFCIRFGSPEKASDFKKHFEEAMDANAKLLKLEEIPAATDESAKEGEELASELENVKVEDKKESKE